MKPSQRCAFSLVFVLAATAAAGGAGATRIEARSADFLAVGVVHEDRLEIHLSRVADNAPVHDAAVSVLLRGVSYPTTAEADGGYSMESKALALSGDAVVQFQISQGLLHETAVGQLSVPGDGAKPADQNSARQLGWWVLNFTVCIGFLMLWSRRRKAALARDKSEG